MLMSGLRYTNNFLKLRKSLHKLIYNNLIENLTQDTTQFHIKLKSLNKKMKMKVICLFNKIEVKVIQIKINGISMMKIVYIKLF